MAVPLRPDQYSTHKAAPGIRARRMRAGMNDAAKTTVLQLFPYGLYAVTVKHGGEEHGMTANWVVQTSFEPPMVAVAVENTSRTIELIRDAVQLTITQLL